MTTGGRLRGRGGATPSPERLSRWWPVLLLGLVLASGAVAAFEVYRLDGHAGWRALLLLLTVLRHLIELLCVVYATCFIWAALRYRRVARRPAPPSSAGGARPPLAVIYLCCGDEDEEALESLSRLRYSGPLLHLLHDDSEDPVNNRRVDRLVRSLAGRTGTCWRILRRPRKQGGKPGALNYVLEQTSDEHELFLLADNDSFAEDPDILEKAVGDFANPDVAVVQFRNQARVRENDGTFAATVAQAVDIFDVFMTGLFDGLWRPFVGHNAILRTRAVAEAGGFTPGVFADDLDLTVRLNLQGRRVDYRRDLCMQECHPANYRSFCLRSKKWAQGCGQVIRMHLRRVLASPRMTARQKLGFLLFCGFYLAQVAALMYIALVFLVLPLMTGAQWSASPWSIALGTLIPATIFLPVIVYLRTEARHRPLLPTLGACIATYGSTDVWTALGLRDGFARRSTAWVPTNSVHNCPRPWVDWSHFGVGASLLVVPYFFAPALLLFPVTWLFAAKYLFVPAVAVHYGARAQDAPLPATRLVRISALWLVIASTVALLAGASLSYAAAEPPPSRVAVRGDTLLIDGAPTIVRGIHYSPWRPGQGPGRGFDWPAPGELASDLEVIRSTNANTILVYDAPAELLDLASDYGLNVIYVFNIEWWRLPDGQLPQIAEEFASRVEALRGKPAIIAWILGNEVPGWVIDHLSVDGMRQALSDLRTAIRRLDPHRPVGHGNWPLLRGLDLDRDMDLLCYNVYPFYPTEVIASGYGRFIEEQIRPLARGRPILITEFGVNTIEVSPSRQAEVLEDCWRQILEAGCQGGVVFEFADEWWKNYDNPIQPPDWWRREQAPDDHLTEDLDPEENYGIVTARREPKPALATVRGMFGQTPAPRDATLVRRMVFWGTGGLVFGLLSLALWLRLTGTASRLPKPDAEGGAI